MGDMKLQLELFEQWENIVGYEGYYRISSSGKIKSLARTVKVCGDGKRLVKEKILKPAINGGGYPNVDLMVDGKRKNIKVHVLVWEAFGHRKRNGRIIVIDHIDDNKLNNNISNLQLLTHRENVRKRNPPASKHTGIIYNKTRRKWCANKYKNNKTFYIGAYRTEEEAILALNNCPA